MNDKNKDEKKREKAELNVRNVEHHDGRVIYIPVRKKVREKQR